jgi:hypothetical protein
VIRAEQQVYAALSADSAVVALVGDRIYPDIASVNASLPLVVFERTATLPTSTIHANTPVAAKVTISASAWAVDPLDAQSIANAMEAAMNIVAPPSGRFNHFDEATGAHASVVDFDVWEI